MVADENILNLIERFLSAGVMEDGVTYPTTVGTPQGGVSAIFCNKIGANEEEVSAGPAPAGPQLGGYRTAQMQPIYTHDNTTSAFQLNWSVSLFGKVAFLALSHWLDQLKSDTVGDGVRILEARLDQPHVGQFFLSTRPEVAPSEIVRSVTGRWQYLIRTQNPSAFQRNYFVGSLGDATCRVLDQYVAGQTDKHSMVDAHVQKRLQSLQFHDATVDLAQAQTTSHGRFIYSLQVVVENLEGLHDLRETVLADSRAMILGADAKKRWRLSRIAILSNHYHILLGTNVTESPASVALSIMNNLAYVQGMKPVLRFSYYVGTCGPYDRDAVRRHL